MIKPNQIIRSNRKTLSVSVDCFARITVRAPKRCGDERIFAFLEEKKDWILRKQAQMQQNALQLPSENLDGYTFPILGKNCTVRLTDERFVRYDAPSCVIYLPRKNAQARLVRWLKENAKRIFTALVEQKAAEMGTSFLSVDISSARTRWGTCAHDNALRFTFRLLYAPKEIISYVVVHELAHTRHKNHSSAFWREVEKYEPNYRQKRKWLKARGMYMQIF